MNKFFSKKAFKIFICFFLFVFLVSNTSFAQTPNVAAIEEPKTGIEVLLFLMLLMFMILAPAFKKREWPKLRKGYDYFLD